MWCFVSFSFVVSISAIGCLERLVSEMTCYVLSVTLHPTRALAPFLRKSLPLSSDIV